MFPFWEMVVAPIVKAARAERVLEIGALRGETTAKMFDQLGPTSELHVIDPLPQFDPGEHEAQFPGRYVFHRALSLDVLDDLPPFDVALIDGDHNWYTVFHELQALQRTSRDAGRPLPVLVLHDVAWPYGHRDLYYEPSQIPEEFRQPHRRAGMAPGRYRVLPEGGLNADLDNAIDAGGPRNGVMCALDDFLADHDRPYRRVVLPFYFGLAIVVEQDRLDATPALTRNLDALESAEGRERLLKLSERIRIDAAVHEHNWNRNLERRVDGHRRRYLDLLQGALLDEHYLENEIRLEYLLSRPPGTEADAAVLRDPARNLAVRYQRLARARRAGGSTDGPRRISSLPYTDIGHVALDALEAALVDLEERAVGGDLVECGGGRGGGGVYLRGCLAAHEITDRDLWIVDRFLPEGTEPGDEDAERQWADLNQVRDAYARFDLLDERVRFVQGVLPDAVTGVPPDDIALLRVGSAVGDDLTAVLRALLPRVRPGGLVIVEGVGRPIVEKRLRSFLDRRHDVGPLTRIDHDTVRWQQIDAEVDEPEDAVASSSTARVPLAPPVDQDVLDLSIVVVFYDMRREAARTLQSLSSSYQEGAADLAYEVVVVDNGSSADQRLSAEEVAGYGPQFRLLEMGDDAPASPTVALNHGIAATRGRAVALMIDGAHVLTPGVFRQALTAMAAYEPAVVAVQQWYVGPGQQGDVQQAGYDQTVEDQLFRRIQWPRDGYRLFEIGHFIGDRDWFDGIIESNCLFVPRTVLEQIGGFDDSFDEAGGGYANLELFERVHSHPGVNVASVLGEGTFHQFHGGTTTNVADEAVRRERILGYRAHFEQIRGRPLLGVNKPVHYVGAMDTKAARRTRSRREFLLAFDRDRDPVETTDRAPTPIPDELKLAAIEALWDHQAWRETTWLGRPVRRYPTDLQSYQELLGEVRPASVLVVGDDDGLVGRALYLASVAEQLDLGPVVAVGTGASMDDPPDDARVRWIAGPAEDPDTVAAVEKALDGRSTLALLGLGPVDRIHGAFAAYAPHVPVGGYVVIENTILNGRPVASGFGPGPHEAVNQILALHPGFVADPTPERYTITFNKGGYLRRTAPA